MWSTRSAFTSWPKIRYIRSQQIVRRTTQRSCYCANTYCPEIVTEWAQARDIYSSYQRFKDKLVLNYFRICLRSCVNKLVRSSGNFDNYEGNLSSYALSSFSTFKFFDLLTIRLDLDVSALFSLSKGTQGTPLDINRRRLSKSAIPSVDSKDNNKDEIFCGWFHTNLLCNSTLVSFMAWNHQHPKVVERPSKSAVWHTRKRTA